MLRKTSCTLMSACIRRLIRDSFKSAPHNMQLRTVTGSCDALGKRRQVFSIESATVGSVALASNYGSFPNHDKRCPSSPNDQIDVAQNVAVAMHLFQKKRHSFKQSVHQLQQISHPKHPLTRMHLLSYATFSPRNKSASMATACTAPLSETFDLLHERSNCLDEHP